MQSFIHFVFFCYFAPIDSSILLSFTCRAMHDGSGMIGVIHEKHGGMMKVDWTIYAWPESGNFFVIAIFFTRFWVDLPSA